MPQSGSLAESSPFNQKVSNPNCSPVCVHPLLSQQSHMVKWRYNLQGRREVLGGGSLVVLLFCHTGMSFKSRSDCGDFSWLRQKHLFNIIAHMLRDSVFFTERDCDVQAKGSERGFVLYLKREIW